MAFDHVTVPLDSDMLDVAVNIPEYSQGENKEDEQKEAAQPSQFATQVSMIQERMGGVEPNATRPTHRDFLRGKMEDELTAWESEHLPKGVGEVDYMQFWACMPKGKLRVLRLVARDKLGQQVAAVPSERLWSKAKNTVGSKSHLGPTTPMTCYLFLHAAVLLGVLGTKGRLPLRTRFYAMSSCKSWPKQLGIWQY